MHIKFVVDPIYIEFLGMERGSGDCSIALPRICDEFEESSVSGHSRLVIPAPEVRYGISIALREKCPAVEQKAPVLMPCHGMASYQ